MRLISQRVRVCHVACVRGILRLAYVCVDLVEKALLRGSELPASDALQVCVSGGQELGSSFAAVEFLLLAHAGCALR